MRYARPRNMNDVRGCTLGQFTTREVPPEIDLVQMSCESIGTYLNTLKHMDIEFTFNGPSPDLSLCLYVAWLIHGEILRMTQLTEPSTMNKKVILIASFTCHFRRTHSFYFTSFRRQMVISEAFK